VREDGAVATIRIEDLPDDVAETYRRRAEAAGVPVQSYMRDKLVAATRPPDKSGLMAIVEQALAADPGPGISKDAVRSGLWETRGD
jgi:antitoxin FitA